MTKALLIAAIGAVILLVAILTWPTAAPPGRPKETSPTGTPVPSAAAQAEPYATAAEFYAAWQAYLRGEGADPARITATAAKKQEWITGIFPANTNDFHDELHLNLGNYRILYPFLTKDVIDNYGILLTEISNNKPDTVKLLLKIGANPNQELILTAATSTQMIETLIHAGADPNRPRLDGSSPLDYFRHLGRPDLIEAMIRNGAR
jgi:hypothetical protein